MAAVATGGKLLEFAREHSLPHIVIPETGLEPRMAIGFSAIAIAIEEIITLVWGTMEED